MSIDSVAVTLPRGTLVRWHSLGSTYRGFIIGTCSYDLAGDDNAYVVRYVWRGGDDGPASPYAVVAIDAVELADDWLKGRMFVVGGNWSATPADRCEQWDAEQGP